MYGVGVQHEGSGVGATEPHDMGLFWQWRGQAEHYIVKHTA